MRNSGVHVYSKLSKELFFFGDHRKKTYQKNIYQEFIMNVGLHIDMYSTQYMYIVWWIEHVINILLQLLNQIHTPVISMCSGIN